MRAQRASMMSDCRSTVSLLLHPLAEADISNGNSEENYGDSDKNCVLHVQPLRLLDKERRKAALRTT